LLRARTGFALLTECALTARWLRRCLGQEANKPKPRFALPTGGPRARARAVPQSTGVDTAGGEASR
jgi:hypothetical protein